jgi:tRNA U34 5-methylaminomethyl-2-thiouridine-forming methyltransferase MnmC
MKREIITTKDGSHTVQWPEWKVTYHSTHGAIQESMHIFIQAGLHYILQQNPSQPVYIFEMGFGTGLNAFLTAIEAQKTKTNIHYTTIELYPLSPDEIAALNYNQLLKDDTDLFQQIHQAEWNKAVIVTDYFTLEKINTNLFDYTTNQLFNVIYYDAFDPSAQPELWTQAVFEKLYTMLSNNGILVTYSSKSAIRKAMQAAGFTVTKLPGPPGKREIVRATKP